MASARRDESFVLKIAALYYMGGLTQEEIARRFGLSRPTVVRVLREARERKLVEIRLTKELPDSTRIETELENRFKEYRLKEVVVADNIEDNLESAKDHVGQCAAKYLSRTLQKKHVFGIGWSTTLMCAVQHMDAHQTAPSRIVQLGGIISSANGAGTYELANYLGTKLGAQVEHMPAPVLVASRQVRDTLLVDPIIQNTLRFVEKCHIGLVGIGVVGRQSALLKAGYLTSKEMTSVVQKGAVGEILGNFFDEEGSEIAVPWADRKLSVELTKLKTIDNMIVAAAGKAKKKSILGAIRGGYLTTLVVDMKLATALLQ